MSVLGIDIGTGSSRALLIDERGSVRAGYTALHEDMQMAHPQWAELLGVATQADLDCVARKPRQVARIL